MAKSKTTLPAKNAAPAYLAKLETEGMGMVTKNQATPRIKITQAMTDKETLDRFPEGTVIANPGGLKIADKGKPFTVVVLYAYKSFEVWSDVNDANAPTILDQIVEDPNNPGSFRNHRIVKMALNPDLRQINYRELADHGFEDLVEQHGLSIAKGNKHEAVFNETFNYVVEVVTSDESAAVGTIALLSLSGGENYTGKVINSVLSRRLGVCPVIWANRLEFASVDRDRAGNKHWVGLDVFDPEDGGGNFIGEAEVEKYRGLHESFAAMISTGTFKAADPHAGIDADDETA
jgi:hypothetical protein